MALWFPIMVNTIEVGRVEMVRIKPISRVPIEDEMCTYTLRYYTGNYGHPDVDTMIQHPYKTANPIPLLAAALEKINA